MRTPEKVTSNQKKLNKKSVQSGSAGKSNHNVPKSEKVMDAETSESEYLKYKEDGYNPKEQTEDYFWNTMSSNYISPWPRIQI